MWSQRLRPLFRTAALLLLCWTALDLANTRVCAVDADAAGSAIVTSIVPAAIASHDTIPASPESTGADCFCCSPFVDVQQIAVPPAIQSSRCLAQPLPVRSALLFAAVPYHPPQPLS